MRIILIIILYIGIVSACTQKPVYPEAMSQAIQCIETSPDSALLYLDGIPASTLQTQPEETNMYYKLLKVKVNDKLYHKHTSDSIIKEIVQFYDEYGDLHKQMEAYYYLGSVYRDLNDAPRAIKAFLHATKLGENTKEYGLMGKAHGQICILLKRQSVYEEAEKAGRKELEYAILRNDSIGIGYSLRNIARIFHDQHELDSALYYYMKGYEKGAMQIKNIIQSELPWIYYDKGEPEKAKSLIVELFEKEQYSYNNQILLGRIYTQEGELEKHATASIRYWTKEVSFKYNTLTKACPNWKQDQGICRQPSLTQIKALPIKTPSTNGHKQKRSQKSKPCTISNPTRQKTTGCKKRTAAINAGYYC